MDYLIPDTQHTNNMSEQKGLLANCKIKDCRRKEGDAKATGHLSGNKCTNFHSVTFRPPGGITKEQIQIMKRRAIQDIKDKLVVKATFGVEGRNQSRHAHVSLVLPKPQRAVQDSKLSTKTRYSEALNWPKEDNKALHFWQPGIRDLDKKGVKKLSNEIYEVHYTEATFLAYAIKQMGRGPNDTPIMPDWNAKSDGSFLLLGLFPKGVNVEKEKLVFGQAIKRQWERKLILQSIIHMNGDKNFHKKILPDFVKNHCPDIPKMTKALRPHVISRMYCLDSKTEDYRFSSTFFKGMPKAFAYLGQLDPEEDNIQEEVERVVTQRYARLDPSFVAAAPDRGTSRKRVKELEKIVKELEGQLKSANENYANSETSYTTALKLHKSEQDYIQCRSTPNAKYFKRIKKLYHENDEEELAAGIPCIEYNVYAQMYGDRQVVQQVTGTPSPKRKRQDDVQQSTPSSKRKRENNNVQQSTLNPVPVLGCYI